MRHIKYFLTGLSLFAMAIGGFVGLVAIFNYFDSEEFFGSALMWLLGVALLVNMYYMGKDVLEEEDEKN